MIMHIARRALTYTVQNDVQTDLVQTEEQSRARVGESGIFGMHEHHRDRHMALLGGEVGWLGIVDLEWHGIKGQD
jgi:hypothetical protein